MIRCTPGKCKYVDFLGIGEGCYKVGGMKCRRYDKIVIRHNKCLAYSISKEEISKLEKELRLEDKL